MKVDILIWPDIMMVICEDSYGGYMVWVPTYKIVSARIGIDDL